jgi:hypothetical protein
MEHISKVIPGAVAEIFIRRGNRHAFWREYYPQYADEWIAEETSVTGRRAEMTGFNGLMTDIKTQNTSLANSGAVSKSYAKEGGA